MFIILQRALLELFFIFRKYMAYHSTLVHARLLFCLEQQQHEARRNCGTDHTRHIRAHCVHEQEVGGGCFAAFLLGDTRRHWNSGNTSRADQGFTLPFVM